MNLRILEDLHGHQAQPDKAANGRGYATRQNDGDEPNRPKGEGEEGLPPAP
jgi:hypothetical protein